MIFNKIKQFTLISVMSVLLFLPFSTRAQPDQPILEIQEEQQATDQELLEQLQQEAIASNNQAEVEEKKDIEDQEGEVLGVQFPPAEAAIKVDSEVLVNAEFFLDAQNSYLPPTATNVSYFWDLGDGTIKQGREITHIYREIGEYEISLVITSNLGSAEAEAPVKVRKEAVFFIIGMINLLLGCHDVYHDGMYYLQHSDILDEAEDDVKKMRDITPEERQSRLDEIELMRKSVLKKKEKNSWKLF